MASTPRGPAFTPTNGPRTVPTVALNPAPLTNRHQRVPTATNSGRPTSPKDQSTGCYGGSPDRERSEVDDDFVVGDRDRSGQGTTVDEGEVSQWQDPTPDRRKPALLRHDVASTGTKAELSLRSAQPIRAGEQSIAKSLGAQPIRRTTRPAKYCGFETRHRSPQDRSPPENLSDDVGPADRQPCAACSARPTSSA